MLKTMLWFALALRYVVLAVLCVFFVALLLYLKREKSAQKEGTRPFLEVCVSGVSLVGTGKRWYIDDNILIGRGMDCAVRLPDPYVSHHHARVFKVRDIYMVEDLSSKNGTYLNGKRVLAPVPLKSGDRLQIGGVIVELNLPKSPHRYGKRFSSLMFYPGMILAAGGVALYLNGLILIRQLVILSIVAVSLSIASLIAFTKIKGDPLIFLMIGLLSAIGLTFLYRINPAFGVRQSCWVIVGTAAFWGAYIFHYKRLNDYKYLSMALGVVFLLLTMVLGIEAGGARSWLSLGSFRFQPSEFVKIFMAIFLAGYLDENREILTKGTKRFGYFLLPDWPYLFPLLTACGLSLLLLVFQRDLGMALLFFALFLAMVYAATGRLSYLLSGLALFGFGAWLMFLLFPHVQERIAVFLNPWKFYDKEGYQIVQSLYALGGGGAFGWGLGSGFPELIPAVHTDFIFPLVGEELGLAGALEIVVIYALLVWRGMQIAINTADGFGCLLAFGCSSLLALQALIILGGVVNLIPLTGIPLPFLSYGGSSFVSNCFIAGLLTKISEGGQECRRP